MEFTAEKIAETLSSESTEYAESTPDVRDALLDDFIRDHRHVFRKVDATVHADEGTMYHRKVVGVTSKKKIRPTDDILVASAKKFAKTIAVMAREGILESYAD